MGILLFLLVCSTDNPIHVTIAWNDDITILFAFLQCEVMINLARLCLMTCSIFPFFQFVFHESSNVINTVQCRKDVAATEFVVCCLCWCAHCNRNWWLYSQHPFAESLSWMKNKFYRKFFLNRSTLGIDVFVHCYLCIHAAFHVINRKIIISLAAAVGLLRILLVCSTVLPFHFEWNDEITILFAFLLNVKWW